MIDLDRTIITFGGDIIEPDPDTGEADFLTNLADLYRVEKLLPKRVNRSEILSWWTTLETYKYENEAVSFYEKVFQNPALKKPVAKKFTLNDADDELDNYNPPKEITKVDLHDPKLDPDLLAVILGATRLKAKDLQLLVVAELPEGIITLNLAQLSHIYRVASFCRALKLTILDYLTLKTIYLGLKSAHPLQPLASLEPSNPIRPVDTLQFIEVIGILRKAGLSPEELDYVLRHQVRPKASFVLSEEEIGMLLKELQPLVNQHLQEAYPEGISTQEKFETKLVRVLDPKALDEAKLIIAGKSELEVQERKDFLDETLIFFPDPEEAKTQLIDGGLTDLEERYEYALSALDRYLLESVVIQQLAKGMDLDVKMMALLLKEYLPHPVDASRPALQTFLDEPFIQADPDPEPPWTAADHPGPFALITKVYKLILVITTLKLDAESLSFLMDKGGSAGLPDLRKLPLTQQSEVTPGVTNQWIALCKLILINRDYFRGKRTVFSLLDEVQDPSSTTATLFTSLSEGTNWEVEDLEYLTGPAGLHLNFPADDQMGDWLDKVASTLTMVNRVGATARQMAAWTSATITEHQADSVRYAMKAKYGNEQWLEVAAGLRDRLREQQRDALVNYVLHHVKKHNNQSFDDVDDIYSYYLMDTQTAACAMTSRIVLASSSAQLFVQRIMMNLEPGMSLERQFAEQWKWRKYYRVWEANRKVLIWPENWIEPDLRDDKTPFFKELESELLQDELNEETVERAYVNYLHRLDEVARLTICGEYYDDSDPEHETLHVFGQTAGVPSSYFYRRWEKRRFWTPWEKVGLDIYNAEGIEKPPKGTTLIPVVHNRRLFLFWPVFTLKNVGPTKLERIWLIEEKSILDRFYQWIREGNDYAEDTSRRQKQFSDVEHGHDYYELRMAWSQYRQGHWTGKKVSSGFMRTPYYPAPMVGVGTDRNPIRGDEFKNALEIDKYIFYPKKDSSGNLRIIVTIGEGNNGYDYDEDFEYDDCKGELIARPYGNWSKNAAYINLYKEVKSMKFMEAWGGALRIVNSHGKEILLLNKTSGVYQLSFSPQQGFRKLSLPFFFEDPQRTFFIVPPAPFKFVWEPWMAWLAGTNVAQERIYSPGFASDEDSEIQITPNRGLTIDSGAPLYYQANEANQVVIRGSSDDLLSLPLSDSPPVQVSPLLSVDKLGDEGPVHGQGSTVTLKEGGYRFYTFYHPYVCLFLKHLNRYGIDGLLNPDPGDKEGEALSNQLTPDHLDSFNFVSGEEYKPNLSEVKWTKPPQEIITFDYEDPYATYNWELFFHVPLLIATRLSEDQRFEEAQRWFHYIFNPTEVVGEAPQRFWKIKPFHTYTTAQIEKDMEALMKGCRTLQDQMEALAEDPFNPHLLARLRRVAYMKTVVMKYLDNLIAWGDHLFRRDSIESINEATQLYVLAGQILGKLPVKTEAKERDVETFNSLAADLSSLGNAWVELENFLQDEGDDGKGINDKTGGALDHILYFCMPPNEKLLSYWDTVADRLFKIRHCMNIEGIVRELPLFQPPIDPALLVKAAAGIDISSAINDLFAPLPHYRFVFTIQRAQELCQELKSLGSTLLSVLEKKDAEALALLRTNQEIKLLEANREIKAQQIKEAKHAKEALDESKELATIRKENYEERKFMNPAEAIAFTLSRAAAIVQSIGVGLLAGASGAYQGPDVYVGGLAGPMGGSIALTQVTGGNKAGDGITGASRWLDFASIILRDVAQANSTMAGYQRRQEDWDLQVELAEQEEKQFDKQILGAEVRIAIAERDKENLELQIEQARSVAEYMRNKYTDQELYNWMAGQISRVYFQTYQLVYDIAKQAEKTFRFELGIEESNYIQFGYWENRRKGLLAGERLYLDLKHLEAAYYEKNKRDYEITKHFSLMLINPQALIELRQSGTCEFEVPELLFDLDFPGQYFRRIKSVSITLPCIVGPYTSVSAKLTLLKNRIRRNGNSKASYKYTGLEDEKFQHNLVGTQSIATSQAQGDSGLFELNFRDERYLPFEGAGAISTWRLELPTEFHQFDYDSISDVILHMNYMAREGGDLLKQRVNESVRSTINKWVDELADNSNAPGLPRLFGMKHEFPNEWHRFFSSEAEEQNDSHKLSFNLQPNHFPFFLQGRDLEVKQIKVLFKVNDSANILDTPIEFYYEDIKLEPPPRDNATEPPSSKLEKDATGLAALSLDGEGKNPFGNWRVQIERNEINLGLLEEIYVLMTYTISEQNAGGEN